MARQTSFHTRHPGNESQQGGRQPRQFDKRSGQQPEQQVRVDREAVIRRQSLKKLVADVSEGVAKVALVCELTEDRVKRLCEGHDVINHPMAMHIEESIGLPAGWMDSTKPVPKDAIDRLERSLSDQHDDGAFTIDVDGGEPQMSQSKEDGDVIEALSQSAGQDSQTANSASEEGGTPNILRLKEVFPAVHVYLHERTDLSPASISGILSGSRNLTETNALAFEAALNLPAGWLYRSMPIEQIEAELVAAVGDLINMPAPRRGRRPGADSESASSGAAPKARIVRKSRIAKPAKPAKPARVLAPMPPAAPAVSAKSAPAAQVAQATPAAPVAAARQAVEAPALRPYVEGAAPQPKVSSRANVTTLEMVPAGMSLSRALINVLENMEQKGELDNVKVTRVLSALYMN